MKRTNIFAITENGKTQYCESKIYGGAAGISLRFCLNAQNEKNNFRPFIDRLDRIKKITHEEWQKIADAPHLSDNYYSFIEVDVDKNIIYIDEAGKQERCYHEISLDKLLKIAKTLIKKHRYSGYFTVDKKRLYSALEWHEA